MKLEVLKLLLAMTLALPRCQLVEFGEDGGGTKSQSNSPLGSFVKHHEKLTLHIPNAISLLPVGQRAMLHFEALGKRFKVSFVRSPKNSVFASDAKLSVIGSRGRRRDVALEEVLRHYVEGHLIDDPGSYVYGDVSTGIFDGIIVTSDETFFVEPAAKYFDGHEDAGFDVVVYRQSDVFMCPMRAGSKKTFCRLDKEPLSIKRAKREMTVAEGGERSRNRYGKTCHSRIIVDYTYFQGVAKGNRMKALNEVNLHMKIADDIFKNTDFDSDGKADGIGLSIIDVKIFAKNYTNYPLHGQYKDSNDLLMKIAEFDFSDVCAGFVFTNRLLSGGVLGAAYRGSPEVEYVGGICSERVQFPGYKTKLSVNVGFGTFKYDHSDKIVPRGRSIITVAHEYGHMFGSPHDDSAQDQSCNPASRAEKYLMTAKTPLNQPVTRRSREFSTCSRGSINNFLAAKGHCLIEYF